VIHQINRLDVGQVPDTVAAAVVEAVIEASFNGTRFPCGPLDAECYPEGAVVHGTCHHATFFRLVLVPSSLSTHERRFMHRWGSRQTVPIVERRRCWN